ncbi:G2/M phase-specific E3 ubiquitin-protein ligase-like, partial [Haliotis rubra]|uniref:G2/M phase-specific E3 ubiquitin-protein ligase-like n=1 Tax=Haliotis rubra TaxID=36100 RepID=UPI001EE5D153
DETQESILIKPSGPKINTEGRKNIINVSRDDLLSGAKRGFQRASFKEESQLSVRFSGENGIDDGGPSREIMRLALRELRDSCIFTGPPDSRNIQVDVAAEEKGRIFYGRTYHCLHPYPWRTTPSLLFSIDLFHVNWNTNSIADATDEAGFLEALVCVQDIVDFIGALSLSRYVKQKELVQALTTHIVVKRKRDVIEQFKDGLRTLDVLNQMEKYPRTMKGFFTATDRPEVDAVQVDSLFTVIFSEPGSNHFQQELKTQVHWRDFLQDLEETQSLGKLLAFVTGLDEVPPLGFWPQLRLEFSHPGIDSYDGTPYANTCANSLRVPVLQVYQSFKEVMMLSLEVGTVFTNA